MEELQRFHPKGKMPSKFTIELQKGLRATLRFEDKRDFEEAERGFVAAPSCNQIMAEAGNVAWGSYEFLLQGDDFDSIHASLQRHAFVNMTYGIYEVVPAAGAEHYQPQKPKGIKRDPRKWPSRPPKVHSG
jgi:alkyl sulfatase BDS1-like metallo-beta-lactamase superfamily hydrolase